MKPFSLSSLIRSETVMTVLDVGASLTDTAPYQPLVNSGVARVIGFEPNKEECEKLKQLHGATHDFFPYFVGDGKPAMFRETNWFATGSLFKPNKPLLELYQNLHEVTTLVAEHPIQTVALDDIPEITDVDYIKIDVQGAELSVFEHAARVLQGVTIIHTEVCFVELYEGQPLFADIDKCLREKGFQFVRFTGFGTRALKPIVMDNNPNIGNQYLWSDAIYIRDLLKVGEMPVDKLIKLATIVHDIYGLYDFALYLLKLVDAKQGSTISEKYLELILAN